MTTPTPKDAIAPLRRILAGSGWSLLAMALDGIDLSTPLISASMPSGDLHNVDAACGLFGDDLVAMRIPFAVATILWVGLLAACFRRFLPAPAAAALALVGFLWGPPLFTAAMPSWYLLYLATAVCWALLRWNETEDSRWWGVAGLAIGVARFFKIHALFILAGAGCILLTDERLRGGLIAAVVVLAGVAAATMVVSNGWPWAHAATLALPLVALAAVALYHQSRANGGTPIALGAFLRPAAWLSLGVAIVVVPWVLAYAIHGGLHELGEGLFVLPFRRPHAARLLALPFELVDLLPIVLLPVLLFVPWKREWAIGVAVLVVALAFLAVDLATVAPTPVVRGLWRTMRGWGVLALLMVAVVRYRGAGPSLRSTIIVGWIAAWFALIQYPFAGANYLAYVAPLLLLAGVAAVHDRVSPPVGTAVTAALLIWTLGLGHGQSLNELGYTYRAPQPELSPLEGAHGGGLLIPTPHVELMTDVIEVLDHWGARTLVAGPDAPHLYYLSGRPIPDREFFEFLAPDWSAEAFERRILAHDPDAVILNAWAPFSGIPLDSVAARLKPRAVADTILGPYRILLFRRHPPLPCPIW